MSVGSLSTERVQIAELSQTRTPQGTIDKTVWTARTGYMFTHSDQLKYNDTIRYGAERNMEYRLFFFEINPRVTLNTTAIVTADGRRFVVRNYENPRGRHWEIVGSWLSGAA